VKSDNKREAMNRSLYPIVVAAVIAMATITFAPQASATNESKLCANEKSCTHVTNNENWIKNVESYNLSGKGTCDYSGTGTVHRG